MPYNTPPKCFICGKVHPCDTNDIIQMVSAKFVTVNVCKHHNGVQEEKQRQENLPPDEKAELARKTITTPEFKLMMKNYTEHLIEKNPHHEEFLREVTEKFI